MGKPSKKQKVETTAQGAGAAPSFPVADSKPRQEGRRLILKFIGGTHPELDRIECRWSAQSEPAHWQQGDSEHPLYWREVAQALSLIFLDYLAAREGEVGPTFFSGARNGSLAASLGDAISDTTARLHSLLMERLPKGAPVPRVKQVFGGKNVHGKDKEDPERRIFVRSEYLPADCIEVYWGFHSQGRILDVDVFRDLPRRIRESLGIPIVPLVGEGSPPRPTAPEPVPTPQAKPPESTSSPPPDFPELRAVADRIASALADGKTAGEICLILKSEGVVTTIHRVQTFCQAFAPAASPQPLGAANPPPKDSCFESKTQPLPDAASAKAARTESAAEDEPEEETEPPYSPPAPPPIAPWLFQIHNPDQLVWEDSQGLLDFSADDSGEDVWRLKDACEGVLILGAPGSGKTSGSGFAFAAAFIQAGFGGLVLAAKPDEARRWESLCARCGRGDDCVVVTPTGPFKLNALAYETERPGERLAMTDDLIAFFRVLIAIVSKQRAGQSREDFWTNATNQLMRELFDVFLLASEPLTVDGLTRFLTKAPEEPTKRWREIPVFGSLLTRAEKAVKTPEDKRIYERVRDYWTVAYPRTAHQTRSGVVLGFTAMANALTGRGIHELISAETTVTPEIILSGKIVVLNLSIKDCGQGGLLIQAAWKFLFQRAVERRADKGLKTARPVFLWEDEGHMFFSQHDIDFQPTARDCRAAHVIISQSLHNFYQLGHNPHAVQGVFATMNTQVFHANGDLETNKWASEKMGTAMKTVVNVSVSSQPKHSSKPRHWFFDAFKPDDERESTSSASLNQHREAIFQPEAFAQLKKGGDGSCQAVVLWVSHQFNCNEGRPFRVTVFQQDDNQP